MWVMEVLCGHVPFLFVHLVVVLLCMCFCCVCVCGGGGGGGGIMYFTIKACLCKKDSSNCFGVRFLTVYICIYIYTFKAILFIMTSQCQSF